MRWFGLGLVLAIATIWPACAEKLPVPETPFLRLDVGMHTAPIKRLASDGSGSLAATASEDKTVRLWSLPQGQLLHTFRVPIAEGREGRLYATALSPDGATLLAAGQTGETWDGAYSIYFFDVEKRALRARLPNLPEVVMHLAFSPDGKRFAAALGGRGAVGVWNVADGKPVGSDAKYEGRALSVAYTPGGGIVSVAEDGFIRLYDGEMVLKAKTRGAGKTPYSAAVSPDGQQVAVGYLDTLAVEVFALPGLQRTRSLPVNGLKGGNLAAVAWSGGDIVAGGTARNDKGDIVLRRWNAAGQPGRDVHASNDAIAHLLPALNGGVLFASSDPAWGMVDAGNVLRLNRRSGGADFRGVHRGRLALSADGLTVEFGTRFGGEEPLRFDMRGQSLRSAKKADPKLVRPITDGLPVTNWNFTADPRFAGRPLGLGQGEMALSLALTPDRKGFVLGADYTLRLYDAAGRERKAVPVPGAAWGVVVSGDGSVAVAALGDGTLRWYSLRPGQELTELAALFTVPGREQWVAWTVEGLFGHAERGGKEMVGYHFNQGKAKTPQWVDFEQLYRMYYAPDLLAGKITGAADADIRRRIAANGEVAQLRTAPPPLVEIKEYCFAATPGAALTCAAPTPVTRGLVRKPASAEPAQSAAGPDDAAAVVPLPPGVETVQLRYRLTVRGGGAGDVDTFANQRNAGRDDATRGLRRTDAATPAEAVLEKVVRLDPGTTTVYLRAWDAKHAAYERSGALAFSVAAKPATTTEPKRPPKLFVIAIAVDAYSGEISRLGLPVTDAKTFVKTVSAPAGKVYGEVVPVELYDAAVTRENIYKTFTDVAAKVTYGDSVLMYIGGHGVNLEENKASYFFVTQPVTAFDQIATKGLSDGDLTKLMGMLHTPNVLLVLDTCYSGSFLLDGLGSTKEESGHSVLVASQSTQEALDRFDDGHGIMMRAIVDAYDGKSFTDPDGEPRAAVFDGRMVSAKFGRFVADWVKLLAVAKRHDQDARFFQREKSVSFPIATFR